MNKKQAVGEMSANMPLVDGIFFEIHGSKLKPDPSEIAGQAAKIYKSHRTFFFSGDPNKFCVKLNKALPIRQD